MDLSSRGACVNGNGSDGEQLPVEVLAFHHRQRIGFLAVTDVRSCRRKVLERRLVSLEVK